MTTELTWLGHGSWSIDTSGQRVLLDPFLDESPTAPVKSAEVDADVILVSHGHFDHVSDVTRIAHRTKATVVANVEIAKWFATEQNVENTVGMNLGGSVKFPFGKVKMTLAHHSSVLPDGTPGGSPAGFLLTLSEGNVYFACDTALFLDMKMIGVVGIDLAVLPIGGHFTMGPEDSIQAIKFLTPNRVVPAHYGTFPLIEQDANSWAECVKAHTGAEAIVLQPGEKIVL